MEACMCAGTAAGVAGIGVVGGLWARTAMASLATGRGRPSRRLGPLRPLGPLLANAEIWPKLSWLGQGPPRLRVTGRGWRQTGDGAPMVARLLLPETRDWPRAGLGPDPAGLGQGLKNPP